MSILSDAKILEQIYDKKLEIKPFLYKNVQPSSIDLTLDSKIMVQQKKETINVFDKKAESSFKECTLDTYELKPSEFILAQIKETLSLPNKLMGNIQNRNSLARLGINVGLSSYINPGYRGKLTIAIQNIGISSVELVPGMRICQLILSEVKPASNIDYSKRKDAKYHNEKNVTLSKLYEDLEFEEYRKSYKKSHEEKIDKSKLIKFFEKRIKANQINIEKDLSPEHKQKLGL